MWWKRFIGTPVGISSLPRDKLESLYTLSYEQLQKMQNQESALKSEINDITFETTRQLSMVQNTSIIVDGTSDEVCPPNYSASERRRHQLRATISQMMADKEQLEAEIAEQQDLLCQYIELHQVEAPIPKDSLLVGPFNNTDLRKIYTQLKIMSETSVDDIDKDDFSFCLDVLSGESKILAKRMEQMRALFNEDCVARQEDLDSLITEATRIQRAVQKLHDQMETLTKKSESLRPVLPSVRKDLQNEINALGDTHTKLQRITKEIDSLREQKEQLKDECTTIGAELLLRPLDDVARKNEMDESVQLRQHKTNLDLELHELEQTKLRLQSEIQATKDLIDESNHEAEEMEKQSQIILDASDSQRWKFDKLTEAKVTSNDLALIREWSGKMTPDEMERSSEQMKEHITLLEKRKKNMKRRITQLSDQEKQYESQIDALKELLDAGKINDEDLPA